jgi:flagellin-specific chaperone FliS
LDDLYERTSRERKQVKKILEKEDIILEVLSFEKALKIVSEIHSFKSLHPDYSMIALRDVI